MGTAVAPQNRRDRSYPDRERAVYDIRNRLPVLYRQKRYGPLSEPGAGSADSCDDLFALQQRDRRAGGARVSARTYRGISIMVVNHDSARARVLRLHRFGMAAVDLRSEE